MGSVHVLVPLCSHGGVCEIFFQHFGLSYAVRTSLQAYSAWKPAKVARLWGGRSVFGEVIKDFVLYSRSSLLFRSSWNNIFELCAPLCPLEEFYK